MITYIDLPEMPRAEIIEDLISLAPLAIIESVHDSFKVLIACAGNDTLSVYFDMDSCCPFISVNRYSRPFCYWALIGSHRLIYEKGVRFDA